MFSSLKLSAFFLEHPVVMSFLFAVQAAQLNQQKSLYEAVFDQHLSAAGILLCTTGILYVVFASLIMQQTIVNCQVVDFGCCS